MFTIGQFVRYRKGTDLAGEIYLVAESQYSPDSSVRLHLSLTAKSGIMWANPTDLEPAE